MIQVTEKAKCCGCTACYSICPKSAIQMRSDSEGFLYPDVSLDLCVNCGRCDAACPILHPVKYEEKTEGFIIRNKDARVVEQSTSGGFFTLLAEHCISRGYTVYGAGYDPAMRVVCKAAITSVELEEMRGSKFVQSYLGDTFQTIRKCIKSGQKVLFTGTPCQVAGLIGFLGEKPENLLCVDFVCRGVPSPGLWENYVRMMEKRYGAKIIGARFKHKTYGYHATTMRIEFANGKTWYGSGRVDPMMKAFVSELASRPSCHECVFKGTNRVSDITMFDCYEFSSITGYKDDDKGYSSLLVHTDKGKQLIDAIREKAIVYEAALDKLVTKNGIMITGSAKPNPKRNYFYELAGKMPIDEAIDLVSPITAKDQAIESIKGLLHQLGVITLVKKFKKQTLEINR